MRHCVVKCSQHQSLHQKNARETAKWMAVPQTTADVVANGDCNAVEDEYGTDEFRINSRNFLQHGGKIGKCCECAAIAENCNGEHEQNVRMCGKAELLTEGGTFFCLFLCGNGAAVQEEGDDANEGDGEEGNAPTEDAADVCAERSRKCCCNRESAEDESDSGSRTLRRDKAHSNGGSE